MSEGQFRVRGVDGVTIICSKGIDVSSASIFEKLALPFSFKMLLLKFITLPFLPVPLSVDKTKDILITSVDKVV